MIRDRRSADAAALARLLARAGCGLAASALADDAQIAVAAGRPVGAAWLRPVPGLPGLAALHLAVDPDYQRQGHGDRLLAAVASRAADAGYQALSAAVSDLEGPAGRFLLARRFVVEHVEVHLRLADLGGLPAPALPPGLALRVYPPAAAARHFLRLYDAAFGPHPWYQPYDGPDELRAELAGTGGRAADMLFLLHGPEPVGCAWLRRPDPDEGEIEPIGLVPAAQGRGWGRHLLLAALDRLRQAGCRSARIACWADNAPARGLYAALGFRPAGETIFLSRPVG